MQSTSEVWKRLWADPNTDISYKIVFDGAQEFTNDIIPPVTLTQMLMPENGDIGLGTVASHELTFSIRLQDETYIRGGAKVELFIRLENRDEYSEWLPKGVFFVENRKTTLNRVDFECVDAVLRLDTVWLSGVSVEYRPPMREALAAICTLADIEIANLQAIPENYTVGNVNDLTKRQVVSFIASASGCNAALDDKGRLRFYPLTVPVDYHDVGAAVAGASEINDALTIKKITAYYSEGEDAHITKGSGDSKEELFLYNEWVNEPIVSGVYSLLRNYTYKPLSIQNAHLDPAFELGDGIIAGGVKTQIFIAVTRFDGHALTTVSVPGDGVFGNETRRYIGAYDNDSDRRLNRLRSDMARIIVACRHISTDGDVVTLRPVDENIVDIRGEGTYHFTVNNSIPPAPFIRIEDHTGRQLALRKWVYTNGRTIRGVDFIDGARVEVRDSGEYFFSDAVGDDPAAMFQVSIGSKILRKFGVPGCCFATRGNL